MKQLVCLLAAAGTLTAAQAQQKIEWRKDKVTQIILPEEIRKFRAGYTSDSALSQSDGRVLYIQPIREMGETNLNVVTSDGNFYAFDLMYNDTAQKVNYIVERATAIYCDAASVSAPPESEETQVAATTPQSTQQVGKSEKALDPYAKVRAQGDYITANNIVKLQKLVVLLKGVYVDQSRIYFKICIENGSNVPFDVDYIAFSITAKTTKKTSTQERLQIQPAGADKEIHRIDAKTSCEVIYAFEKFTIGKDKILLAEVLEQGGDRNIGLRITDSFIIDARKL